MLQRSIEKKYERGTSWVYFSKMGQFPLLTKAEEIQVARRIEKSQGEVVQVMLRYPHIVLEVIRGKQEHRLHPLCERMERIAANHEQLRVLRDEGQRSYEQEQKQEDILQKRHETFRELKPSERQIDNFILKLESHIDRSEFAENISKQCVEKTDLYSEEVQRLSSSPKRILQPVGRVMKVGGISFNELLRVEKKLLSAPEEIRQVESETRTNKGLLKQDLKEIIYAHAEAKAAKTELVQRNLRLVITIAKKYSNRGVPLPDLIQEGNIGLMRAVNKFDYRRGYKFSTYASWWIRQAIIRAIQDQALTIRMSVHMHEAIYQLKQISLEVMKDVGRMPTPEEIAERIQLPIERVKRIIEIARRREAISLDTCFDDGKSQLGNLLADENAASPEEAFVRKRLAEQIRKILATLTPREQKILRKRFGIGEARAYTLKEIGDEIGVTRERVRQIEAVALTKLRKYLWRKNSDFLEI